MRRLLDITLPSHQLRGSLFLVLAIAACILGRVVFTSSSLYFNFSVEQDFAQDLRISMLDQMNHMTAEYHEETPVGDKMSRLERDVDQIAELGADILSYAIRSAILLLLNLFVMFRLNPTMALAVLPSLLLFFVVRAYFRPVMQNRADVAQSESGRATAVLYEHLAALPQIQLLGAETHVLKKAIAVWKQAITAKRGQRSAELLYTAAATASLGIATLLVLGTGSIQVLRGRLTIGSLVAFYTIITRMLEPVSLIMDLYSRLQRVGASIRRVRAVLESHAKVRDFGTIKQPCVPVQQGIVLDRVRFRYRPDRPIIDQFSLSIAPGERIAIAGPSGTGKSTLARLLVRLSDPESGEITLDGYPLRAYTLKALRHTICYVPQRPVLFQGTIRDNLLYGNPAATDSELQEVIAVTQLGALLRKLGNGLDTNIGPMGYALSGGESQRLALARALLRKCSLLILDESTSALDLPTEERVLRAVSAYCSNAILIVIAHRLPSLGWVDRIAVLSHGRLAAIGDHISLYEQSDLYRTLYQFKPHSRMN